MLIQVFYSLALDSGGISHLGPTETLTEAKVPPSSLDWGTWTTMLTGMVQHFLSPRAFYKKDNAPSFAIDLFGNAKSRGFEPANEGREILG